MYMRNTGWPKLFKEGKRIFIGSNHLCISKYSMLVYGILQIKYLNVEYVLVRSYHDLVVVGVAPISHVWVRLT